MTLIQAEKTQFGSWIGNRVVKTILANHFSGIYLQKHDSFISTIQKPTLMCVNHSCRWDAVVALFLGDLLNFNCYLMMASHTIRKYRFLRKFGFFEMDASTPIQTVLSITYAAQLLQENNKNCVIVFPQGQYQRSHKRPLSFLPGFAQLVRRAKYVNILPVALHYDNYIDRLPEVFISLGETQSVQNSDSSTHQLTKNIEHYCTYLLDTLQEVVKEDKTDQFHNVLEAHESLIIRAWKKLDPDWKNRAKAKPRL